MLQAILTTAIVLRQQEQQEMKVFNSVYRQRGTKPMSERKPKEKSVSNCEGLMHWFLLVKQGTVQIHWKLESNVVS